MVLLAVLVVVVLLTLAAYQFTDLMMAEYKAADSYTRSVQARSLADSGVAYASALVSSPDSMTAILNDNPYDNPQAFQSIIVHPHTHPRFQGRFSIIAVIDPDDPAAGNQPYRFGVSDESGKLNLNALLKLDSSGKIAHDVIINLPNMTESIANAIVDWIDADDEPRADGAENEYYTALDTPYRAKNGPLDTLEELLFVQGVTPQLLFGNDKNRNGTLEPDEDDGSGTVDRGWSAYLTVHSREQNLDFENSPRLYINDQDLQTLYTNLQSMVGQDLADYIVAYRLYGPASSGGSGTGSGGSSGSSGGTSSAPQAAQAPQAPSSQGAQSARAQLQSSLGSSQRSRPRSLSSLYELVNSSVSIPVSNQSSGGGSSRGGQSSGSGQSTEQEPITLPSPLNDPGQLAQLLPTLLDKVTTVRDTELPARVNINTAPKAVLAALPGLDEADVQAIIDHRPGLSSTDPVDPIYQTPAWLLTEANLLPDTLRTLERYITARSQTYRVQVVGFFDGGGPTARLEVVIDTNGGRPRLAYWRDLTELGKGFELPILE